MPAYIWYPTLAGLTTGFSFMNIPPVADQFMNLFGVGYAGLSLFLSGLLWSHSLSQIPAGMLVDKKDPFRLIAIFTGIGVLLNLLPFLAPDNLALGTILRFLLGLCTGVTFLSILKVIALLTPPTEMAKAQGYYGGAFGFGTMLPYFMLPFTGASGWICSYLFTAAFYLAAFIATLHLSRQTARQSASASTRAVAIPALLRRVLAEPDIWMLGLLHGMLYGTLTNLGQWLPSILADMAESPLAAWTLATTIVLFIGSCSRWFSGHATKAMPRRRVIAVAMLLMVVLYCALGMTEKAGMGFALGVLLAVPAGICHGSIFTMGARVLPPVFLGTALGLLNSVANLMNVGLTLLFGNVRERTGSFSPGLLITGGITLLLLLVLYRRLARLDARVE